MKRFQSHALVLSALGLAACTHAPATTAHVPSVVARPTAKETPSAAATKARANAKPDTRVLALDEFTLREEKAKITPFLRDALEAVFNTDGTGFVSSRYGGWFVSGLDAANARSLKGGHYDGAILSRNGRMLATIDDAGRASVFDSRGKRLWSDSAATPVVTTAGTMSWPSISFVGDTLHFWNGCELRAYSNLSRAGQKIGQHQCGLAQASSDGKRWALLEPTDETASLSYANASVFTHIDFVDVASGVLRSFDDAIVDVRLDPSGKRAYLTDTSQRLSFLDLDSGESGVIGNAGVLPGSTDIDASGRYVIYAVGTERFAEKSFFLYDSSQNASRFLLRSGAASLRFLPGSKRVVRSDGLTASSETRYPNLAAAPGAVVYDLERQTKVVLWEDGEIDGLSLVPGSDRQFLIGRERNDTRDLYAVELPD